MMPKRGPDDRSSPSRSDSAAKPIKDGASGHSTDNTSSGDTQPSGPKNQVTGIGDQLGPYQILDKLGEGGMGAVFKARHTKLGRLVALKVLPPKLLSRPDALARFEREMIAVGKLNHPNVVQALDAGEVGGVHYLSMEYIEGQDLNALITAKGPMTVVNACKAIRQAAQGLAAAHKLGLVHRDIKPSNLFVTRESGQIKILDLGLALLSQDERDSTLTSAGERFGTPDYMAPEQWDDAHSCDARADLYALGCTLFHLLIGRPPYSGDGYRTLTRKMMGHVCDPIPDLKAIRDLSVSETVVFNSSNLSSASTSSKTNIPPAEIPEGLNAIYRKMMAKAPEGRFASAEELAEAIAPFTRKQNMAGAASGDVRTTAESKSKSTAELPILNTDPRPASQATISPNSAGAKSSIRSHWLPVAVGATLLLAFGLIAIVMTSRGRSANNIVAKTVSESTDTVVTESTTASPTSANPPQLATSSPVTTESQPSPASEPTPTLTASDDVQSKTKDEAPQKQELVPSPPPKNPEPSEPTLKEPRTLIVGTGNGEINDLKAAIAQAHAGDTILIRHRGPLEFQPIDLTNKTPLTIAGDVSDGVDYWPVLRQSPLYAGEKNDQSKAEVAGLFRAKELSLTFRKIHLVAGGPDRAMIGSIVHCTSGRVEFDQCTVTVGIDGYPGDAPGAPLPLLRTNPENDGPVQLAINGSFFRGQRLQSLIVPNSPTRIDVNVTQTVWAGGPAPWIVARQAQHPIKLALRNCTLYNIPSFVHWESESHAVQRSTVDVEAAKCVFVGPFANKEPFVAWNPGNAKSDFASAVAGGIIQWRGSSNVFHRYSSFFSGSDRRKQSSIEDWRKLWRQSGSGTDRKADPMFRVWPEGYELQEALARDYQPRLSRTKGRPTGGDTDIGADHNKLPNPIVSVFYQPVPSPEIAVKPRGVPRVVRVHQAKGPYKTLESAFEAAREGDVIEIASDGPFIPVRNFGNAKADSELASADTAVIPISVSELTVRATDDVRPLVILDGTMQQAAGKRSLVLFYVSGARSFSVEGIHFHLAQSKDLPAGIAFELDNRYSRWTNCGFTQANEGVQSIMNWVGVPARFQTLFKFSAIWLENNSYRSDSGRFPNLGVQGPGYLSVRNCLSVGPFLSLSTYAENREESNLAMTGCSIFGQAVFLNSYDPSRSIRMNTRRNLVVQTNSGAFVSLDPAARLPLVYFDGADNCISWSDRIVSADEREFGLNKLLPGPTLTSLLSPEGPAAANDLYRPFRLQKGQAVGKMAPDGGPIGVRFEYLPNPPAPVAGLLHSHEVEAVDPERRREQNRDDQ